MDTMKKVVRKVKSGFLKDMVSELRWILKVAIQYRFRILAYALISILTTAITFFFTFKTKDLVDLLVSQRWKEIVILAVYYVSLGSLNIILSMFSQRMASLIECRIKRELAQQVYEKIICADWLQVIKYHSGDLMVRMNEDINAISGCMVGWLPTLLTKGIQILFALGVIVYYDASMLLVIGVVAPIIVFGSRIFLGKVYAQNKKQREVSSELLSFQKESFQNIQMIKAFDLRNYFSRKVNTVLEKRERTDLDANKYSLASWAVMYISGQIAALICMGWALYHVYLGYITLGTMALMITMASTLSGSFKALIGLIPSSMSTVASSERVRKLLLLPDEEDEEEEKSHSLFSKGCKDGITVEIEHLSFSYQTEKVVFRDVNLIAEPGEIVALVGPSGEGKTTMLRVLLGLVKAQSGNAIMKVGTLKEEQLKIGRSTRKFIAYVPQGNTIMNSTIADNMRMLNENLTDDEIIEALKAACAWEFVEKLPNKIYHMIGEGGIGFSEGQNQRLAIARAILCESPILLLDEATSALDVATERRVLQSIIRKNKHRTCILTTHRPSVLTMCDKVYRIDKQKVTRINDEQIRQLMNDF